MAHITSTSLGRNALLLAATSAGSYLFGVLRDRLLANTLGASRDVDIFNSAFLLPDLIMNLFAAAITTAFIPVLAKSKRQYQSTNEILTVIVICIIFMDVVAWVLLPWIVTIIAPGFNPTELAQLTSSSRWLLLSPLLFGISILLGTLLQSKHHFLAYAISPMLYNVGICIGIIWLTPITGVLIGAGLHLFIRLIAVIRLRYWPRFATTIFHSLEVTQTLKLIGPRIIGLLAIQATLWTYNAVGSTLEPGSVAVFNFARNFQSLPVSFIGIALATVLFPVLAQNFAATNTIQLLDNTRKAVRMIIFLTLPAMIGMMFVSQPLVSVFLGGGEFDAAAITRTSWALLIFALVIPLESLQHILARVFYAQHNTKTPAWVGVAGAVLNVIVCLVAAQWFGVIGLVLGFIATTAFIDIALLWWLADHGQRVIDRSIQVTFGKCLIASGVMMLGLTGLFLLPVSQLIQLIVITGTGILLYIMTAQLLRVSEMKQLVTIMRR
ncbi:MAG: integral membrane protein MviN [uncultured bacterium]|nr:MAG: integral membrane protein MviN [uncultured bacterium]